MPVFLVLISLYPTTTFPRDSRGKQPNYLQSHLDLWGPPQMLKDIFKQLVLYLRWVIHQKPPAPTRTLGSCSLNNSQPQVSSPRLPVYLKGVQKGTYTYHIVLSTAGGTSWKFKSPEALSHWKSARLAVWGSGFQAWFCHSLAMQPWARHLSFPFWNFSIFIYKREHWDQMLLLWPLPVLRSELINCRRLKESHRHRAPSGCSVVTARSPGLWLGSAVDCVHVELLSPQPLSSASRKSIQDNRYLFLPVRT